MLRKQVNVHHMHGYTTALVLPEGVDNPDSSLVMESRKAQHYVIMSIRNPMENPFQLISNANKSLKCIYA